MPQQTWPCLRLDSKDLKGQKGRAQTVVLDVSVSPNAKKTELVGWHDGPLRIRLAAPPVDGAANDALRKWLAEELDLAQSKVVLMRGATGRRKQWALDVDLQTVVDWLGQQPALQNSRE